MRKGYEEQGDMKSKGARDENSFVEGKEAEPSVSKESKVREETAEKESKTATHIHESKQDDEYEFGDEPCAYARVPQMGLAPATVRGLQQLQDKIDHRRGLRARQRLYEFYKYI